MATTPIRLETFINAGGNIVLRIGGVSTLSAGSGYTSPGPVGAVELGGDRNIGVANMNMAQAVLAASEISGSELSALDAYSLSYWGVP